jgi:sterol 24-C-methyltransferase
MADLPTHSPASSSNDDLSQAPEDEKPQLNAKDVRAALTLGKALSQSRLSLPSRLRTKWQSFRTLYKLTPAEVDAFMASYIIYSLDWADAAQMTAALGPKYRERVGDSLQAYYGVLNHLCALGEVEKMYIPPLMNSSVSLTDNQLLYERTIAYNLKLQPSDHILDLGCGRGRIAAHLAGLSGARVTGLTIDATQVEHARRFNALKGLRNDFVRADFNELPLPFADEIFDGFYQVQVFSLVQDLPALCREVFRVLKPGARFSLLDYVSLPAFDPSNPEHVELLRRTKPLLGAIGTPTPELFVEALQGAGFTVIKSENASRGGHQAELIKKADVYFRALRKAIHVLVKARLLPRHFTTLIDRLCLDGDAFVQMDQMDLITTTWSIIAKKPKRPRERVARTEASQTAEKVQDPEKAAEAEPTETALPMATEQMAETKAEATADQSIIAA